MEDRVDLFGDRQFDVVLSRQSQQRRGGVHAFGHHAHVRANLVERAALAKLDAHVAVTAERSCAGEDEIAQARQSAERFRPCAQRHG